MVLEGVGTQKHSMVSGANDTKSDGENVDSSDEIKTKDIQSPQNVTITETTDVTTNAKSNNAENSDKINVGISAESPIFRYPGRDPNL